MYNLSENIVLLPYRNGSQPIADQVRKVINEEEFEHIAIDLPEMFKDDLCDALSRLPIIHAVVARSFDGPAYYIPTDPCDAAIEGIRQAISTKKDIKFIGSNNLKKQSTLPPLPDPYSIYKLGFEEYTTLCFEVLKNKHTEDDYNDEIDTIIKNVKALEQDSKKVLLLLHYRNLVTFLKEFHNFELDNNNYKENPPYLEINSYPVNPDHLYFLLGELPFITAKAEQERYDPFAERIDLSDLIKELFRDTRESYYDHKEDALHLSPVRIQNGVKYLRNLTIQDSRFIPDLFDIITSAKGIGGNQYALKVLENARYYPYLPYETNNQLLNAGIDMIRRPTDSDALEGINLLRDENLVWKKLSIKPDPSKLQKKKYKYRWNPHGFCSHLPEDRKIESFNKHVRTKAMKLISEDLIKTEKFETSVKDGIDIRETLRNWHTKNIYIKELPPSRGKIDTVVIIFDEDNDDKYPERTIWYAEHAEESTLTFYSTDPFGDLIGPGVARCTYGGLSLLFPPVQIPSAFELTEGMNIKKLSHRLTYGALAFTQEKSIAYISAKKPDLQIKKMATKLKKSVIWIPLNSFSNETMHKIRKFHILNGHEVRSWATRFIGD